jgi:hypothetical protein
MGTTCRRADVVGSKRLKVVLLAAVALTVAAPGLAHATTVPAASYYNGVAGVNPDTYPAPGSVYASQTSYQATGGVAIAGSNPPFTNTNYSASTSNNYNIPSVSARAVADSRIMATAGSSLFYYVEFGSTTASTVTMRVTAYGEATLFGDGSGTGTRSQNNAEVGMVIDDQQGNGSLVAQGVSSDLGGNQGLQSFSFDQMVTFDTNVVYQILIRADVTAAYLHEGYAYVDPYFYVPDGITFSISDGIGNTLPNSVATPIPATLPLFASGLCGLGYLARRRRKSRVAA